MQSPALNSTPTLNISSETTAHNEHPDLRMTGMAFFLVAESMIFLGLFAAFLITRSMVAVWQPEGSEVEILLPGINTIILISSSFVMNRGATAIKKNDEAGLRFWFGLTALMGAIFLGGQAYEYLHTPFGLTTSIFASFFYVLTGFHGLHVTFGLMLILMVLWRSRKTGHYSEHKHFGVEAAELYWHFVDVVWIILFILVYLL